MPPPNAYDELESGQTTPVSIQGSGSVSPLSSSLLSRLSFWKRRPAATRASDLSFESASLQEASDAESFVGESPAAGQLQDLLEQAPPPATQEEKRSQVEAKVVKEVIREFSRGIFFFAYDFGET